MRKVSTEEIIETYLSGESQKTTAEKLGISINTVQRRMKAAGFETRPLSEAHKLAYETGRHIPTGATGEDHWAWKGGKERRPYRDLVEKEECDDCGVRNNLSIHHIDFDHYNNDPENLRVLCVSCHMRLHKKAYWDARKAGKEPPRSNGPIGWDRQ